MTGGVTDATGAAAPVAVDGGCATGNIIAPVGTDPGIVLRIYWPEAGGGVLVKGGVCPGPGRPICIWGGFVT